MVYSVECPLTCAAKKFANKPAIIYAAKTLTYSQLAQCVEQSAVRLKDFGIKRRNRIAIYLSNCPEYIICLLALWRIGAVACPLSIRLPKERLETLLVQIDCQQLITSPDCLPFPPINFLKKYNIYDAASSRIIMPCEIKKFRMALSQETTIIFTSGSTSHPKAVLHSYGNHYFSAKGSNKNIPVRPGDRWLLSLPLYHAGGLGIILRVLLAGATIVIAPEDSNLTRIISKQKVTHASFVATQLYRFFYKPYNFKILGRLKAILLGGSPIPDFIIKRALHENLPIYKTYGLTEMASQVAATTRNDLLKRRMDSYRILPFRQVKITDDGEIFVKGETLCQGYVRAKSVDLPLEQEGWFRTGDFGRLDNNGRLYVTGRKDNMFISGGENIQPEEIERKLCSRSDILNAVVVPVANKEFGARPVAFIKPKNKSKIRVKELTAQLERHVERFKIPDVFFEWPREIVPGELKINRQILTKYAEGQLKLLRRLGKGLAKLNR